MLYCNDCVVAWREKFFSFFDQMEGNIKIGVLSQLTQQVSLHNEESSRNYNSLRCDSFPLMGHRASLSSAHAQQFLAVHKRTLRHGEESSWSLSPPSWIPLRLFQQGTISYWLLFCCPKVSSPSRCREVRGLYQGFS